MGRTQPGALQQASSEAMSEAPRKCRKCAADTDSHPRTGRPFALCRPHRVRERQWSQAYRNRRSGGVVQPRPDVAQQIVDVLFAGAARLGQWSASDALRQIDAVLIHGDATR
jgi:hypothetical protein